MLQLLTEFVVLLYNVYVCISMTLNNKRSLEKQQRKNNNSPPVLKNKKTQKTQ